MSLQSRLATLISAIGLDIKALQARTPGDVFGDGSDGAWTTQVTPTNVMANPDAAVNATGWAPFTAAGGAVGAVGRVADAGFTGGFAFEDVLTGATGSGAHIIYPGGTASFVGGVQNVVPKQVVDFSGQVKAQAGAYSYLKLVARWMKADGSLIAEVDVPGAIQNTPTVGTVYSFSGSLAAPALAAYAGVEIIGLTTVAGNYTMRASNLNSRPIMPGSTRVGAVYTLTRDVYFTDLVVNSGVSIVTHGYRIFCRGTLSGAGTISADGGAGQGRSAGVKALSGSIEGGYSGADGGVQGAAGSTAGPFAYGHGGIGGAGGAGGFAAGTQPFSPQLPGGSSGSLRRDFQTLISPFFWNFTGAALYVIAGGGGGSGGGGSSTGAGGGGGGGGGIVVVVVRSLSGTIAFTAKGGAGNAGNPTGGTNAGGGGGGGGGAIHLIYASKTGWAGTTDVSGGAAGAGNGTGASGVAGTAGNVIELAIVNDGTAPVSYWGPWTALPFAANWANYGGSEQSGQYRVSIDGKNVQLRGLIRITGATITLGGANSSPTTLPAGARPSGVVYRSQYTVAAGATGTTVLIGIDSTGIVKLWTELSGRSLTFSSGTYLTLDGIEFSTEA